MFLILRAASTVMTEVPEPLRLNVAVSAFVVPDDAPGAAPVLQGGFAPVAQEPLFGEFHVASAAKTEGLDAARKAAKTAKAETRNADRRVERRTPEVERERRFVFMGDDGGVG